MVVPKINNFIFFCQLAIKINYFIFTVLCQKDTLHEMESWEGLVKVKANLG